MPNPTLHPNLAKIAAAYDEIIERLSRGQLQPPAARALIAQLEARDDDGVRWSIDPDSGRWVRKTAFGDAEFDAAPPTYGYRTFDAHDLTPNVEAFNPADRLTYQAVDDSAGFAGSLMGATRRQQPQPETPSSFGQRLRRLPAAYKRIALAAAVALVGVTWAVGHLGGPQTPPAPLPPAPAAPAAP